LSPYLTCTSDGIELVCRSLRGAGAAQRVVPMPGCTSYLEESTILLAFAL